MDSSITPEAAAVPPGRWAWWLRPFQEISSRMTWLRAVLALGCLAGMLFSAPLWTNSRAFLLLPVAGFPQLAAPWDAALFALALASLAAAACSCRAGIVLFLASAACLSLADQNRWQPWFYLDAVLLGTTLLPERSAFAACRVTLALVYFWAGAHKCNAAFFTEVAPFLAQPFASWLPANLLPAAQKLIAATPAVEVFIALALWIPSLRRPAIALTVAIHLVALLILGPWGHRFNPVVWPWNLSMPLLVIILPSTWSQAGGHTPHCDWKAGALAAVVGLVLPILGFFGWCDAYLSFRLYSGNTARVSYLISPGLKEKLPASVQQHLHPPGQASATGWNGPWELDFRTWTESTLRAPALPESRLYLAVGRELARQATRPDDLRMWLVSASGQKTLLRATDLGGGIMPPKPSEP
jgi:hypothetical protein